MASLFRLRTCALAVGLAAGCGGPDHEGFCERQQECIGGNDADLEACIVSLDYLEDSADDQGCDDEYEAVFECRDEKLECDAQDLGFPCSSNADCDQVGGGACSGGTCRRQSLIYRDPQACQAEERAYSQCAQVDLGGI